jgi:hypothetical protein
LTFSEFNTIKLAAMRIRRAVLLLCLSTCLSPHAQTPAWLTSDPGFHPLAIVSIKEEFWICGPNESIASSPDGKNWTIHHRASGAGAMLFGIEFFSPSFGYAYGTGGTVLFTSDGGDTWVTRHFGNDTILVASFADPTHGLLRTAPSLFYLDGSDSLHQIAQPADTLQRFPFTPFLVALSQDKMTAVLSEGPYSEGGFLSTIDGGKTWSFYDPPSTGIKDLLRVNGKYWATGHEVVGKDKPGGGYGVPMATYSDDGTHWTHTTNEIHPCHWEYCVICNSQGCLASDTLLVNFFHETTTYSAIPKGALTAKWAVAGENICTLNQSVTCASLRKVSNVEASPEVPLPKEQTMPRLGTKPPTGALRCVSCSLEPVFIDDKVQGRVTVHIMLQVGSDGTVEMANVEKSPSDSLTQKIHGQIMTWLFEPPTKDGQPIRVKTESDIAVNVIRRK